MTPPSSTKKPPPIKMAEKLAAGVTMTQKCMNCGRSENDAVLFPARTKGESTWVCVKCLPALIHG